MYTRLPKVMKEVIEVKNVEVYKEVEIQSYKHNGKLHRIWEIGTILDDCDDCYVVATKLKTLVYESDGRYWYTREPAIIYFFKEKWFNVTAMIRKDGIYYYCNLGSPSLYDEESSIIKYIDYDLDVKVYPDYSYNILDVEEYEQHRKELNYPKEIDTILKGQLDTLTTMINEKKGPFAPGFVTYWYSVFKKINKL